MNFLSIILVSQSVVGLCDKTIYEQPFDQLSAVVETMARIPPPARRPPTGRGVVTFGLSEAGRASDIVFECAADPQLEKYLKDFLLILRFSADADRKHRFRVGLEVSVDEHVRVRDFTHDNQETQETGRAKPAR